MRFWKAWHKGWLRTEILDRYGARCVLELVGENHRPFPGLRPICAGARYLVYSVSDERALAAETSDDRRPARP